MAPKKGNLLTYRKDISVVDATIRDGGLCNNFYFDDSFIRDLYHTNLEAGVDYMEFGYKASKDLFDPQEFGKWKFCDDQDIYDVVGDNDTDMKIAVMADVGRTNFKRDIVERSNSPVDLIRIATYINTMPAAIEMIEYCAKMGYETTCNIMAVSKARKKILSPHWTWSVKARQMRFIWWTVMAHYIRRRFPLCRNCIWSIWTDMTSRLVFMHIIIRC